MKCPFCLWLFLLPWAPSSGQDTTATHVQGKWARAGAWLAGDATTGGPRAWGREPRARVDAGAGDIPCTAVHPVLLQRDVRVVPGNGGEEEAAEADSAECLASKGSRWRQERYSGAALNI